MTFRTDNIDLFSTMVSNAVKAGLEFTSYSDNFDHYIIEYTGGY